MASAEIATRVRYRFYLMPTILLAVVIITLTAVFLAATLGRFETVAQRSAGNLFSQIVERHAQALRGLVRDTEHTARAVALMPVPASVAHAPFAAQRHVFNLLAQLVDDRPSLYGMYFGFHDGSFVQLIAVRRDARLMAQLGAPVRTHFALRSIDGLAQGVRREHWWFLDSDRAVLGQHTQETRYDPRERPWYASAMSAATVQLTAPYLFESLNAPGMTFSSRLANGEGVLGVDLSLAGLERFIAESFGSQEGGALIADDGGRVLARFLATGERESLPHLLREVDAGRNPHFAAAMLTDGKSGSQQREVRGEPYIYAWHHLDFTAGKHFHIAAFAPMRSFTGAILQARNEIVAISAVVLLVSLLLSYLGARSLTRSLSMLTQEAERVREFDFSGDIKVRSLIYEVDSLGTTLQTMKSTIALRTNALKDAMNKLQALVQNGMQLSMGLNRRLLMRQTIASGRSLCLADAGLAYLVCDDARLVLMAGGSAEDESAECIIPLAHGGTPGQERAPRAEAAGWVVRNCRTLMLDLEDPKGASRHFDVSLLLSHLCLPLDGRPRSLMVTPMIVTGSKVVGVLAFVRAGDADGHDPVFEPEMVQYVELLATQTAIAIDNIRLLDMHGRQTSSESVGESSDSSGR